MSEIWKAIPGYEGYYEVSDLGRVRSLDRMVNGGSGMRLFPGRIRKQSPGSHGYMSVSLSKEGVIKVASVHVLVLLAFRGPPPLGMEACHDNGKEHDNALSNLRWDTRRGNQGDKYRHGTAVIGSKSYNAVLDEASVVAIKEALARGEGTTGLAERYGVAVETIHSIKAGKSWRHV